MNINAFLGRQIDYRKFISGNSYTVKAWLAKNSGYRLVASGLMVVLFYLMSSFVVLAEELRGTEIVAESPSVTVYVGVRDDAKPFSYIDITSKSESIISGYSGYSVEVCRHVLKEMKNLPKYRNFEFKAGNIKAVDRFKELGRYGKLFMLCGPDSITQERLIDYWASQPYFLSGMTYAYLNPRSPNFPRGAHCGNIIGVVRGTTADTEGLPDIAARGLLMRFNKALNLELSKKSERIAKSREMLRKLVIQAIADDQLRLDTIDQPGRNHNLTQDEIEGRLAEFQPLAEENLTNLVNAVDVLADEGNDLAKKVRDLMRREHGILNRYMARDITTEECPLGFSSLPVRKFEDHDQGVSEFCKGNVIYYLADFDILKNKIQEKSDCDVVMNPFARSREVYGAFFSKKHRFVASGHSSSEISADKSHEISANTYLDSDLDTKADGHSKKEVINAAGFYADFNNILTRSMQGELSDIEKIFSKEFGNQEMSDELASFFDSVKIE